MAQEVVASFKSPAIYLALPPCLAEGDSELLCASVSLSDK